MKAKEAAAAILEVQDTEARVDKFLKLALAELGRIIELRRKNGASTAQAIMGIRREMETWVQAVASHGALPWMDSGVGGRLVDAYFSDRGANMSLIKTLHERGTYGRRTR